MITHTILVGTEEVLFCGDGEICDHTYNTSRNRGSIVQWEGGGVMITNTKLEEAEEALLCGGGG